MAQLNSDVLFAVESVDDDGSPYDPTPAFTVNVKRINASDGSEETLVSGQASIATGTTGRFSYVLDSDENDALGILIAEFVTTDTSIDPLLRTVPASVDVEPAVDVDLSTIEADLDTLLARTVAGVTFVGSPVDSNGNTRIVKGVRYTGSDRLHYTTDSTRDLSSNTLVALEFQGESFPADEITGSSGAWDIYIPLTNAETDDLMLGRFEAQLSVYDTSPNPDQEIPELARFKVTVERNL